MKRKALEVLLAMLACFGILALAVFCICMLWYGFKFWLTLVILKVVGIMVLTFFVGMFFVFINISGNSNRKGGHHGKGSIY
jgi:hypothetical protein